MLEVRGHAQLGGLKRERNVRLAGQARTDAGGQRTDEGGGRGSSRYHVFPYDHHLLLLAFPKGGFTHGHDARAPAVSQRMLNAAGPRIN
jgi:hypothetical protein